MRPCGLWYGGNGRSGEKGKRTCVGSCRVVGEEDSLALVEVSVDIVCRHYCKVPVV
jgi:hypothetical protein